MSTDVGILARARELVEQGWCQETMARDKKGRAADCLGEAPVAFCLWGARERAAYDTLPGAAPDVPLPVRIYNQIRELTGGGLHVFKDRPGRTRGEVLGLLDRALEAAKEKPA